MRKWLVLGLACLTAAIMGITFSVYLKSKADERRVAAETRAHLEEELKKVATLRVETASARLGKIKRLEELEAFAAKDVASLSKGERAAILPDLRTKLFEANFRRAELYLLRAGDLLRADNNHPVGKEYVERARAIYGKMDKLIEEGVAESFGDLQASARLNYMKGVYFYRLLIFVKDPKAEASRVGELVGLSAKHLSAVFTSIPKEINAEYALEILQKKAESMGASSGDDSGKTQLELLPSRGSQPGPTFAIEGMEEGRH